MKEVTNKSKPHTHQWKYAGIHTDYYRHLHDIYYDFVCECGDYKVVKQGNLVEEK